MATLTHTTETATELISIERPDLRAELDLWDDAICELDMALQEAAEARRTIDEQNRAMDRIEAGHALSVEGGNAETRKAKLTLMLADDARYREHEEQLAQARLRLADADRRVLVTRERCRLLRASLALLMGGDER